MKYALTLFFTYAVLFSSGCTKKSMTPETSAPAAQYNPDDFSGTRAFNELRQIVDLGLRDAGTPGAEKAARYIQKRLIEKGVEANIDEFKDYSPKGETVFRNVIGRIPGRGEGMIILGSHYDTKSGMGEGFEGANDSGSSTAALIELAEILAAGPEPGPEIIFAFFDGEECMKRYGRNDGLHGSKHLVKQLHEQGKLKDIKAMILLDMIGDKDLNVTIPRNSSPKLVSIVFSAAKEEGVRTQFSLYPFEVGDDHAPFFEKGVPAIDFIDFYYGSASGKNDYWHTADDRIEHTSAKSMETVGRIVIHLLNSLLNSE